ncbi:SUF system Fe-S cluster assembly protein [Sandaracinobacteroides hominis]|uniref:SUF system Fe-S cluster assembly protein n=1 Tax=Sandaracinobacteroides hominis TaxID=2780086 RepID=UPI0018F449B2|nr:SUF system Fe-S cluster assembly protein [Sandaracinobacteroides hominis]
MSVKETPIRRFDVEIVDAVEAPPKAPPVGAPDAGSGERKRDYLDGFLSQPQAAATANEGEDELKDAVIAALRDIFDPEIPVNIYDLGLIYGVEIVDGHAIVTMTLTTPHCPVAESMPAEVELRVMSVPGIATCDVNLVWDPPWNPASMSDEARLELGML